jgi:hypothetical protein
MVKINYAKKIEVFGVDVWYFNLQQYYRRRYCGGMVVHLIYKTELELYTKNNFVDKCNYFRKEHEAWYWDISYNKNNFELSI